MTRKTEGYKRLSLAERELIYRYFVLEKRGKKQIAKLLGRSASTIRAELQRIGGDGTLGYLPDKANVDARFLQQYRHKPKLEANPALREYVLQRLKGELMPDIPQLSPEQIAGRMRQENQPFYACHETIYKYIYSPENKAQSLWQHLPKQRKIRKPKYGRKPRRGIVDAVSISERSSVVESRSRFGDWEGDTVLFKKCLRKSVTTLVERKTRYTILIYNHNLYSETVVGGIVKTCGIVGLQHFMTITYDRGTEFSYHKKIAALGISVYFANPSSPWQRPTNENTNGRLRSFVPKGKIPKNLSQFMLDHIQTKMNNTPRKCLGYQTPAEIFNKLSLP
jgi:IS30 family transposase